ncbi:MAG: amino acid adenylation domain-containing protein [Rhodospirillum sp.]|nr:amino acid adenylation domain-containing protein [Rhodospirillum sp.]MCF8488355.1 amino acid adenylation domain-containing protein [Rhodospirillum sp.]
MTHHSKDDSLPRLSISDKLLHLAANRPTDTAFEFAAAGDELHRISYGELDLRVSSLAAKLLATPRRDTRALIVCPPGFDYIVALLACFRGGIAAIPAYPPASRTHIPRLAAIINDSRAGLVIVDGPNAYQNWLDYASSLPAGVSGIEIVSIQDASRGGGVEKTCDPDASAVSDADIALIQYTSGSTGIPKGVLLTRAQITANLEMIRERFSLTKADHGALWLPPYHDMGLIGGVLAPLHVGFPALLMTPSSFVRNPLKWLHFISEKKATVAGGPDFGFVRCVNQLERQPDISLDLSSWKVAFTGAEPIRSSTLKAFSRAFDRFGFSEKAFLPCYGLAEATLIVSGASRDEGPTGREVSIEGLHNGTVLPPSDDRDGRTLIGCGWPANGLDVKIVAPKDSRGLPPLQVGEIRIRGPSVSKGYANGHNACFMASVDGDQEPFLATGDLGFIDERGELFVCGRKSDLIIIRGRNVYPQDAEVAAERAIDASGAAAAFSIDTGESEKLVVLREIPRRLDMAPERVLAALRAAIFEAVGVQADEIALIKPNALPRTTSGKIRRRECGRLYQSGGFSPIRTSRSGGGDIEIDGTEAIEILKAVIADVLGIPVESVNAEEPATYAGLDSLGAILVCEKLSSAFGINLAPDRLIGDEPLSALPMEARPEDALGPAHPAEEPTRPFDLSVGQKAIWHQHCLGAGTAFNLPLALTLTDDLNIAALRKAIDTLISRHPSLRTSFGLVTGEPRQRVLSPEEIPTGLEVIATEGMDDPMLLKRLYDEANKPLDLARGQVFRCCLLAPENRAATLLLVAHHIISDAWSLNLLAREVVEDYASLASGAGGPIRSADGGMAFVVAAEKAFVSSEDGTAMLEAWAEHLSDAPPDTAIPMDFPREQHQTFAAASIRVHLSDHESAALRDIARRERTTLFVVIAAAISSALSRLSGSAEVVLGASLACRGKSQLRDIVGLVMNPVALRIPTGVNLTFTDIIRAAHAALARARARAEVPFASVVKRIGLSGSASGPPLFQTLVTLHQVDRLERELGRSRWAMGDIPQSGAQVDLMFDIYDRGDSIGWTMRYLPRLFTGTTANRISETVGLVLNALLKDRETEHAAVDIVGAADMALLHAKSTAVTMGSIGLVDAISRHAARDGERIAVSSATEGVTYQRLLRKAEAWRTCLQRHTDARSARPVGLLLEKSADYVAAFLGGLMAGAPVVPIARDLPPDHIKSILEQSGADCVITRPETLGLIPETCQALTEPDDGPTCATPPPLPPKRLAYVMFTSGSTGKPKGIGVEIASLEATVVAFAHLLGMTAEDVLVSTSSLSFDISILEIFLPLYAGGHLVLGRDGIMAEPESVTDILSRTGATYLQATPSTLSGLADSATSHPNLTILCGGEPATPGLFARLAKICGRVLNVYGPTETTIWSSFADATHDPDPPLGRPLPGERLHVLNEHLIPVPVGAEGELYIAGTGVARGYIRDPMRTAEKFMPDPFSAEPGQRMFRTGDLVRIRADGSIEFRGRLDRQLKIRGFRIEPEGIDAVLARHAALARSVTTATGDGVNRMLVSILEVREGHALDHDELRSYLARRMPAHAVPSTFRIVDKIPLSSRGKIDVKAALAQPGRTLSSARGIEPVTRTEIELAAIWREALGGDDIRAEDNFFSLGGHSLLAHRVVLQIRSRLRRDVTVAELFAHPRLRDLAARVDAYHPSITGDSQPSGNADGLTDAQRRIWITEQLRPGATPNVSLSLRVRGPLDEKALRDALGDLVHRHEELRTLFVSDNGLPRKRTASDADLDLEIADHPPALEEDRELIAVDLAARAARAPLDLASGPLMQVRLWRFDEHDGVLTLAMHHIACDGEGAKILLSDLSDLYEARLSGRRAPAATKKVVPLDDDDSRRKGSLDWWIQRLSKSPRRIFPSAKAVPPTGDANTIINRATSDFRARVNAFAQRRGVTPFTVYCAAFLQTLKGLSGEDKLVIGTDFAGRDSGAAAMSVSPVVNQVAILADLSRAETFADAVGAVKTAISETLPHVAVSYDKVARALNTARPETPDLFDVKIVHQQAAASQLRLGAANLTRLPRVISRTREALILVIFEDPDGISFELHHRTDLLTRDRAERILRTLREKLEAGMHAPDNETPVDTPKAGFTRRRAGRRHVASPARQATEAAPAKGVRTITPDAIGQDLPGWIERNRDQLATDLAREMALLFRGFDCTTPRSMERIAAAAGARVYQTTEHPRTPLSRSVFHPVPYSHRQRLLWHNEDSFKKSWPSHIWFACAEPAATGGETVVASSTDILDAVRRIAPRLANEGLTYVRRYGTGPGLDWRTVFGTDDIDMVEDRAKSEGMICQWDGDALTTYASRPGVLGHPLTGQECWVGQILHFHPAALPPEARASMEAVFGGTRLPRDCRYADGGRIPDDIVSAISEAYAGLETPVRWRRGDLLAVDNVRAAHGRMKYEGKRGLLVMPTGLVEFSDDESLGSPTQHFEPE